MSFIAASNLKVWQWEEPERLLDFIEIRVHSTLSFVTMQRLYDSAKIVVYYTFHKIHNVLALKKLDKKQFKKNNHLSPLKLQFQFKNQ